ncbi:hypothetical protein V8D89_014346 [Ganoderma adspersum]
MLTAKTNCVHRAIPTKPILPVLTDSEHEVDGDTAPTPICSTWGRGCGCGRGTPSACTTMTRATKRASRKAVSDSEAGDDPADVKTSNSTSEEEADEVASKRAPKTQIKDIEEDDVASVKHGRGRPPKTKAVKSPEVVPSDEEDEPIAPKARSSTKPRKMSTKKESVNEDNSKEESFQKTPKKRVAMYVLVYL